MRPKPDRDIYESNEHCQPGQLLYKTERLKTVTVTETKREIESEREAETEAKNEAETESYAKSWLGFRMRPKRSVAKSSAISARCQLHKR